nr:zinc finger, CCHC-type [Tanacetum cinerariifolium]
PSKRLTSFCYDDDEDYTSAIAPDAPVLSTEEPDNPLSMGDEHLDTILATESDEFIKSSVDNLNPIPSESKGIPDHRCDVPSHDNSPPLDILEDQFEDLFESKEEFSLTDDDSFSFDKIDYVEASPPDSKLVNSEENICLIKKLLYDNSSSRPPKEFVSVNSDAKSESFSPSPILVKDNENPIRTLGDYSKPSHEGYKNTVELPVGSNVVPLRSDIIRLVQNGCSFNGLWSEDPNQHLKDFLKLMDSLDLDDPEQAFVEYASSRIDEVGAHSKEANISKTSLPETEMGIKTKQLEEPEPTLEDKF